jgi:hypothetical protein
VIGIRARMQAGCDRPMLLSTHDCQRCVVGRPGCKPDALLRFPVLIADRIRRLREVCVGIYMWTEDFIPNAYGT